jgi:hypothetical protein
MCLSEAERPVDAGAWIERPEKAWKVGTLTLTYA